jgi:hypothetical protein
MSLKCVLNVQFPNAKASKFKISDVISLQSTKVNVQISVSSRDKLNFYLNSYFNLLEQFTTSPMSVTTQKIINKDAILSFDSVKKKTSVVLSFNCQILVEFIYKYLCNF